MAKSKKASEKLNLLHLLGYGCGDGGGMLTLYIVSGYLTRYVTNVLKLDPAILATMLLVWNIWDAVNDPMMGTLMDMSFAKAKNKNNKFRPWILRSIPIMTVGLIALYSVPSRLTGFAQLAALFALKIVYEAGYTMMNIGMGSLLGVMSTNNEERTQLSSARGFGSTIGGLVAGMMIPQILKRFGQTAEGFMIAGIVCAIAGGIVIFLHYALTEERNVQAQNKVAEKKSEADKVKFTDILNVFKVNRAYLALCVHSICIVCGTTVASQAGTFMYSDVLGDIGMMSMASAMSSGVNIAILSITPFLAKKFELVKIIRTALLTGIVLFVGMFGLSMVTSISPFIYVIVVGLATGMLTLSTRMQWGLVGESIDYNEYLTGKRTEGSIYGTFSLTRRIGSTIASSLGVLIIGWIGYDANAAEAGLAQAASTIFGIKCMHMLAPAVGALGSWIAFTFIWNITKDTRDKMAAWKTAK
ncbi:MAG: MFS transporter [Oscillospiraceae bacterium]|nr:MFS transporter [Oscillospiraceae bacterium]